MSANISNFPIILKYDTFSCHRNEITIYFDAIEVTQFNTSWFLQTELKVEYIEMLNWEWADFDEFENKYGSDNDVHAYAKRTRIWNSFELRGMMVRDGTIDIKSIYPLSAMVLFQWLKFKDVIEEQRKCYYTPIFHESGEYLVNEFIAYGEKIGYPWTPPATLSRFIPDQ